MSEDKRLKWMTAITIALAIIIFGIFGGIDLIQNGFQEALDIQWGRNCEIVTINTEPAISILNHEKPSWLREYFYLKDEDNEWHHFGDEIFPIQKIADSLGVEKLKIKIIFKSQKKILRQTGTYFFDNLIFRCNISLISYQRSV